MKLFYRKYGEGPPLIILHGLYGSSDNWMSIARNISNLFTVYLPDLRNHGHSPHSEIHDYESMSYDLFEFVKDLGLSKFFLAGHSMGGKTAISFTMKWPEMINGLLIADISPFSGRLKQSAEYKMHSSILRAILDTDLSGIATRKDIELSLSDRITSGRIRGLIMKNLQRTEGNGFTWKLNARVLLRNLDGIMEDLKIPHDLSSGITGFPVILIKGENSDYVQPEDIKEIIRLFPASEIKIIKNAGHWLHADNPGDVSESLASLLVT